MSADLNDLKVGQRVRWSSCGRGGFTWKEGVVAYVVQKNRPVATIPLKKRHLGMKKKFTGIKRSSKSYLIEVQPGISGEAAPVLYWPRTHNLQVVPDDSRP